MAEGECLASRWTYFDEQYRSIPGVRQNAAAARQRAAAETNRRQQLLYAGMSAKLEERARLLDGREEERRFWLAFAPVLARKFRHDFVQAQRVQGLVDDLARGGDEAMDKLWNMLLSKPRPGSQPLVVPKKRAVAGTRKRKRAGEDEGGSGGGGEDAELGTRVDAAFVTSFTAWYQQHVDTGPVEGRRGGRKGKNGAAAPRVTLVSSAPAPASQVYHPSTIQQRQGALQQQSEDDEGISVESFRRWIDSGPAVHEMVNPDNCPHCGRLLQGVGEQSLCSGCGRFAYPLSYYGAINNDSAISNLGCSIGTMSDALASDRLAPPPPPSALGAGTGAGTGAAEESMVLKAGTINTGPYYARKVIASQLVSGGTGTPISPALLEEVGAVLRERCVDPKCATPKHVLPALKKLREMYRNEGNQAKADEIVKHYSQTARISKHFTCVNPPVLTREELNMLFARQRILDEERRKQMPGKANQISWALMTEELLRDMGRMDVAEFIPCLDLTENGAAYRALIDRESRKRGWRR